MIFATPSFYDQVAGGRATRLPFAIEIRAAPQWKKMAGRSRHLVSFLNRNPRVGVFWLRLRHIRATKGIPCAFRPSKGRSTRAKREQNARNMRVYPASDYTAPAPFSPSLMDEGITRAVVTKKWRSWRVCIQNADVHIARNSYFKFNTPKLVISYWNESLVVPSFPLSSASSENFPLR